MRIIFLDVDGVLNCSSTKERFQGFIGIDDRFAKTFASLVKKAVKMNQRRLSCRHRGDKERTRMARSFMKGSTMSKEPFLGMG